MRTGVIIVGIVLLLLAGVIGWQFAACYIANSELQSDLKDLAAQQPYRVGLREMPMKEDELREAVIAKAKSRGIQLEPQQVTARVKFTPEVLSVSIAVDYDARVNLLVHSFWYHFNPSSSYSAKVVVK